MEHIKVVSRHRPLLAASTGDIVRYVDSFGWLFVNFFHIVQGLVKAI